MVGKQFDVAVILPDSSPILTLDRIDRLDLFDFLFFRPNQNRRSGRIRS